MSLLVRSVLTGQFLRSRQLGMPRCEEQACRTFRFTPCGTFFFCTRQSEVAPDAVVQRAMRHTSPETKRRYQLGMADQVRGAMEKANESAYGVGKRTTFLLRSPEAEQERLEDVPN
jgi:hypothetical protein